MFTRNYLKIYAFQLKLTFFLGQGYLKYDSNAKRLVAVKSRLNWRHWVNRLQVLLHAFIVTNTYFQLVSGRVPYGAMMQGVVTLSDYAVFLVSRYNVGSTDKPEDVLNSLLAYESGISGDAMIVVDKCTIWMVKWQVFNFVLRPILNLPPLWHNPCGIPFSASALGFCHIANATWNESYSRLWAVPVVAFDTWMGFSVYVAGTMNKIYEFLCISAAMVNHLQRLDTLLATESAYAHHQTITRCRRLQLIHGQWNSFIRRQIVPSEVTLNPIVQIAAIFVIISRHSKLPWSTLVNFIVTPPGAGSYLLFAVGMAGKLASTSASILDRMEERLGGRSMTLTPTQRKIARREVRSLRQLKVEFGCNNFLDSGTALVIEDFVLNQAASLLLMQN